MNFENYCLGEPLHVGTEPVMLLDLATVEDRWGVKRIINVPIKDPRNPLLMPDMPWEDSIAQPNVLYDETSGLWANVVYRVRPKRLYPPVRSWRLAGEKPWLSLLLVLRRKSRRRSLGTADAGR